MYGFRECVCVNPYFASLVFFVSLREIKNETVELNIEFESVLMQVIIFAISHGTVNANFPIWPIFELFFLWHILQ